MFTTVPGHNPRHKCSQLFPCHNPSQHCSQLFPCHNPSQHCSLLFPCHNPLRHCSQLFPCHFDLNYPLTLPAHQSYYYSNSADAIQIIKYESSELNTWPILVFGGLDRILFIRGSTDVGIEYSIRVYPDLFSKSIAQYLSRNSLITSIVMFTCAGVCVCDSQI